MANEYFDNSLLSPFPKGQKARAEAVDAKFDAVTVGLDKLPAPGEMDSSNRNFALAGGTVNNYTLALDHITAYSDGLAVQFRIDTGNTNTGSSTLNVSSIGAALIMYPSTDVLIAGDLPAGSIASVRYSIAYSKWIIQSITTGVIDLAADQVVLAADQVVLAADQVTLAENQVALAADQVALAESEAVDAAASALQANQSEINAATSASTATTQASVSALQATYSEQWASQVSGIVLSTDYSSKAYAIGGVGVTGITGSAKEWATVAEDSLVNGVDYSAKHYAAKSALSAVSAGASLVFHDIVISLGLPMNLFSDGDIGSTIAWKDPSSEWTVSITKIPLPTQAPNPLSPTLNDGRQLTVTAAGDATIRHNDASGLLSNSSYYTSGMFIRLVSGTCTGFDISYDEGSTVEASFVPNAEWQRCQVYGQLNNVAKNIDFIIRGASAGAVFEVGGPVMHEQWNFNIPYRIGHDDTSPESILYDVPNSAANRLTATADATTPSLEGSTTAGSPTYFFQAGKYKFVGRQAMESGKIIITAKGGMAGNVRIIGLDMNLIYVPYSIAIISVSSGLTGFTLGEHLEGRINASGVMDLYVNQSDGTIRPLTTADITDTFSIVYSITGFI